MSTRAYETFSKQITKREARIVEGLNAPEQIQAFLDRTPYSTEPIYRSPLTVLRDRKAHCFDGACFAALCLARLGHRPLLVDLLPWDDDDHVLALFKRGACWGALAKSNIVGLRYREPVYRSLRELVMSYFDPYFNLSSYRTLRGYTQPLSLSRFDRDLWPVRDNTMDLIADGLDARPKVTLFSAAQIRALTPIDPITYRANLSIADPKGLYKPKQSRGRSPG
ncbi:MAG: hypothetical protein QM778_37950 [Myxococcales bacterium]